jgi:hypothetical protein
LSPYRNSNASQADRDNLAMRLLDSGPRRNDVRGASWCDAFDVVCFARYIERFGAAVDIAPFTIQGDYP